MHEWMKVIITVILIAFYSESFRADRPNNMISK